MSIGNGTHKYFKKFINDKTVYEIHIFGKNKYIYRPKFHLCRNYFHYGNGKPKYRESNAHRIHSKCLKSMKYYIKTMDNIFTSLGIYKQNTI